MIEDEPIRILVVDDNEGVREGLIALLKRQKMHVVAAATNGLEAIDCFRDCLPDITLMDLSMPEMGGLAATQAILMEFPAACIIVLTTFTGEQENSLQAGAKAMVLKDAERGELMETIRAVHERAKAA